MKNYVNHRYNLIEDDDLVDTTSDADMLGICLGFVAVCLVMGYCFFLEFVK